MLSFNSLGRLGRLGNQMFQYAVLLAEARRLGLPHCIPESGGRVDRGEHQLLQAFLLPELGVLGRQRAPRQVALQIDDGWQPGWNDKISPGDDLAGFFQSENFFVGHEAAVRRAFTFRNPLIDQCAAILDKIDSEVIALHVRRTDYLDHQDRFPPCRIGYYEAALAAMPAGLPVLVFSDDIAWCRAQPLFADSRFSFSESRSNLHDLCLMTLCHHHIIPNSSFSWWGAWLATHPTQEVVAPSIWYGPRASKAKQANIVPKSWQRLPNQG